MATKKVIKQRARGGGRWQGFALVGALSAGAIGASGCTATFRPNPVEVNYDEGLVVADAIPPNIWAYPHVLYDGGYAYLVDGRWYHPTNQGWMMFRREPVELGRQRTRIGDGGPPRYRRTPTYSYPP